MKPALLLFFSAWIVTAQVNTLTPQEASEGWLLLFDGSTLFGWTEEGATKWRADNGAIVGEGPEAGTLRTNAAFSDYILKLEYRAPGAGAGIILRSGKGAARQSLPGRRAADRWQRYEVQVEGARFEVRVDGRRVAGGKEAPSKVGPIGISHDRDNTIEVRNIKLKPLGLKPIFNGKELSGWRKVERPNTKEPPEWSVRDGMIHVEKGPGQLETEGTWADFILQLDIRTNASDPNRHPNSGVFLRGEPNGFWTGYEAQIRSEFKEGNREAAVDFGTGGIYRYQPARRVVSSDNEFFTMTVTAQGRHLATWVNGYPVGDYTDTNPEGPDVRKKQARLVAGPISLQAHDPTTNLDFRNLRIVELAK